MKREQQTILQEQSSIMAKVLSVAVSIVLAVSLSIPAGLTYAQTAWADEEPGQQEGDQNAQVADGDVSLAAAEASDEAAPAEDASDQITPSQETDLAASGEDADGQAAVAEDDSASDPLTLKGQAAPVASASAEAESATLSDDGIATVNNGQTYPTIQAALDAVAEASVSDPTTFTVSIKAGSYTEDIGIVQQYNKSIVLKAEQRGTVTINGQIIVDGGGKANSANVGLLQNPESVLIDGLSIVSSTTACIFFTDVSNVKAMYYFTHNVTVSNCVFSGGSGTAGVRIGIGGQSYNPAVSNIVVQDCVANPGMHSFFQASAPTRNLSVIGCSANGPKGINAIVLGTATVAGCTFNVNSGYAVRLGSGDSKVNLLDCETSITDSTFSVSAMSGTDEGLIVLRGYAPDRLSVTGCTMSAGEGVYLINNTNDAQVANYQLSLADDYWGPQGLALTRVYGLDGNASLLASSYTTKASFDANGGSFGSGPVFTNKAAVTFAAGGATSTAFSFPVDPVYEGKAFLGWFTAPDGNSQVAAEGNTGLGGDVTLYAHWAEAEALNVTTNVSYPTLAEAVNAAKDGEAISLLKDISVSKSIVIGADKTIALDGGNHRITGAGTVGTVGNQEPNSLFIVDGSLSLANTVIENVGIGIRTRGAASHVDVTKSSITAGYYAIAVRNVNQALTVSDSTLTAWACVMTSGGSLSVEQQKAPTNSSITITNTTLNGKSLSAEPYGAIALQENFNGVTVSITGGAINLGWTERAGSLAKYSAVNVRAYDSTVTIDGTAINAEAAFPAGGEGAQGIVLATDHPSFVGTMAADTSVVFTNVSFNSEIAENAKAAFKNSSSPSSIRDNVAVFINGVAYVPASDGSGVGVAQAMQVTADNVNVEYNGQYHSVSPQAKIGDGVVGNATITYWNDATGAYDLTEAPSFKDVTAAQTVKFQATSGYYSATGSATVAITKRPVTLTSATASKTYDGTPLINKTVTVGGKGFVAGEAPTYTVTGSIADAGTANNAFTWTFPTGVSADNYNIVKEVGILSVNKASLTVHVRGNTDSQVYTGSQLQVDGFTYDNTDKASVTLKNGSTARAQGTSVGSYTMGLTADSFTVSSKNYGVTLEVADGRLIIMEKSIEQQIDNLSKSSTPQEINAVVEHLTNLSQEKRDQMHTPAAIQSIATVEDLYVYANDTVGETELAVGEPTLVTDASVSGAALSVPVTGEALHAELVIEAAEVPGPVPPGIDSANLIPLEVSLNIVKDAGGLYAENIQPKAPITLTMTVADPSGGLDVDRLRIVHYHEGAVEIIDPSNVQRHGTEVTVTFTLASLSPILLANEANEFSVVADNVAATYDGTAHGVQAKAYIGSTEDPTATIMYQDADGNYTLDESPVFTDATDGPQTVAFKATQAGYPDAYGTATVSVSKAVVTVNVVGNTSTQTYTGSKFVVDGYTADATDKAAISLKDGVSAHAEGTAVGTYTMGLTVDSFNVVVADPNNYEVVLQVTDGWLKINAQSGGSGGNASKGNPTLAKTSDPLGMGMAVGLAASAAVAGAVALVAGIGVLAGRRKSRRS